MRKPIRNLGASVRGRLLNLAKDRNQPFDLLLTRYVLERFLYRLGSTKHRQNFVLKGAMLITAWFNDPHRPTRDLDLLGFGDHNPDGLLAVIRSICSLNAQDAVIFNAAGLTVDTIRDEAEYGGVRLKTTATVDGAKARVVIDVAFGDAVEPGLEETELPVLLDLPAPRLRSYPRETVIAEKFQTMVMLGQANSRMKDFYDIWVLARSFEFTGDKLARAIAATFARRRTVIPTEPPDALTSAFAADPLKQRQWDDFVRDVAFQPGTLLDVVEALAAFLMPHATAAWALKTT
jgi:nucleotidyltransferase AbiEii toxin of type IV toxin-antitoxin system